MLSGAAAWAWGSDPAVDENALQGPGGADGCACPSPRMSLI